MKKLLSIILSLTMLMTVCVRAFAVDSVRTARTEDERFIYEAIYDQYNNTVQLIQTNKLTGEKIAGEVTQIPELNVNDNSLNSRASSLEEKTFTNYEYKKTYGTPNKWELRKPGSTPFLSIESFETYQTSRNDNYIFAFQDAVDLINIKEGTIVEALGIAALSYIIASAAGAGAIFTGGTMTPAAWAALLAAGR